MFVKHHTAIKDSTLGTCVTLSDLSRFGKRQKTNDYFEDRILWQKRYSKENLSGTLFDWSKTKVSVEKAVDDRIMQEAFRFTNADRLGNFTVSMKDAAVMEHSPLRLIHYWVKLENIPNYVHMHYRTHNKFAVHIMKEDMVQTGREDRSIREDEGRWDTKNHAFFINAYDLVHLSGVRLCERADGNISFIHSCIVAAISKIQPEYAMCLVPKCVFRNGLCNEQKHSCKQAILKLQEYYQYFQAFTSLRS